MKAREYPLVVQCVERGVAYGLRHVNQQAEVPMPDAQTKAVADAVAQAVVDAVCEAFRFEEWDEP